MIRFDNLKLQFRFVFLILYFLLPTCFSSHLLIIDKHADSVKNYLLIFFNVYLLIRYLRFHQKQPISMFEDIFLISNKIHLFFFRITLQVRNYFFIEDLLDILHQLVDVLRPSIAPNVNSHLKEFLDFPINLLKKWFSLKNYLFSADMIVPCFKHRLTSSTSYDNPDALSELNLDCGNSKTSVFVGVIISVGLQKFLI